MSLGPDVRSPVTSQNLAGATIWTHPHPLPSPVAAATVPAGDEALDKRCPFMQAAVA